jgi:hypothetical protein
MTMNVSVDGAPVQFRLDSPLLACFDPLALDMLHELLSDESAFDVSGLLRRANANHPALACFSIPDFRPGFYALDPHDIRKFGDEDDDLDYVSDREQEPKNGESGDQQAAYLFAAVDSGSLIFADLEKLPMLVRTLTWEQYDRGLQDQAVFAELVAKLGGPYFAVILGGCMPGMEFDGDGTYTISVDRVKLCSG